MGSSAVGPTERSLFDFKAGHGQGGGAVCSQTEAAGGGATPPSRKEEEPVSTVLYLSTDLMDVNTDICQAQGHPPEGRTPWPGPAKGPGAPDLAPNENSSVLPSGASLGPRVPLRTRADRRALTVAHMQFRSGGNDPLSWRRPDFVGWHPAAARRLLRGPAVDSSPGPCGPAAGSFAAFFVE